MKILVVTTSFPSKKKNAQLGGSFVLTECLAYEQGGGEVTVVTPGVYGIPSEEIFGKNIKAIRFSYFFPKRLQVIKKPGTALYTKMGFSFYCQVPFFLLFFMIAIIKHGKSVDIVHCNWTLSALVALPLKWLYKIPIVLTARGSDIRSIPKFINSFIINNIDGVIDCFGPYPENLEIKKMFPANYITLPVIVKDVNEKKSKCLIYNEEIFVVTYIGRFDHTKMNLGFGFFTLIEALALIDSRVPLKCIFVGDGSLMDELAQKVKALGLADRVEFVGYQQNIYKYIDCADVVVGGAALNGVSEESSLKGKPQLLPNIKMWQDNLWIDRANCLLYEVGNPASMAEAIKYAMANPEAMNKIADNVSEIARKYLVNGKEGGDLYIRAFGDLINNFDNKDRVI